VAKKKPKLNDKQKRFTEEFVIDLNATQAVIRAGYSRNGAKVQGSRLLTYANVQERIKKLMSKRSARTEVTQDRVVLELARIAFSDMKDFAEWDEDTMRLKISEELSKDDSACVSEISQTYNDYGTNIKFKLYDKKQALELLGKHLGLFPNRHEHTGKDGSPIQTESITDFVIRVSEEAEEKDGPS